MCRAVPTLQMVNVQGCTVPTEGECLAGGLGERAGRVGGDREEVSRGKFLKFGTLTIFLGNGKAKEGLGFLVSKEVRKSQKKVL